MPIIITMFTLSLGMFFQKCSSSFLMVRNILGVNSFSSVYRASCWNSLNFCDVCAILALRAELLWHFSANYLFSLDCIDINITNRPKYESSSDILKP